MTKNERCEPTKLGSVVVKRTTHHSEDLEPGLEPGHFFSKTFNRFVILER